MRLDSSIYDHASAVAQCEEGITGNQDLLTKLSLCKGELIPQELIYLTAAVNGELYNIPALNSGRNDDPVIVGTLLKSELLKLYAQYFVSADKPARKIYDAILNGAKDQCPFCGGIGSPRNLDHFLPKTHFPQFSILPVNLVPSCLDCNLGEKGSKYSALPQDQVIQPYSDRSRFFSDQWVFAVYNAADDEPGEFEYFVRTPQDWPVTDQLKAKNHFKDFNIASRYSKQAGRQLKIVLSQIEKMKLRGVPREEIITDLLEPGVHEAPFINHWQRIMYQALIGADFY
jgi:hypothetical protein